MERIERCLSDVDKTAQVLFAENWNEFAEKIILQTEEGFPKYQGFMFAGAGRAIVTGLLLDHRESSEILMKKFQILKDNPVFMTSIQGRNPKERFYGGAIRASRPHNLIFGGTGFPEVVDHLKVALCMKKHGYLTNTDFESITDYSEPGVQSACGDVGITKYSYEQLMSRIGRYVMSHFNRS